MDLNLNRPALLVVRRDHFWVELSRGGIINQKSFDHPIFSSSLSCRRARNEDLTTTVEEEHETD